MEKAPLPYPDEPSATQQGESSSNQIGFTAAAAAASPPYPETSSTMPVMAPAPPAAANSPAAAAAGASNPVGGAPYPEPPPSYQQAMGLPGAPSSGHPAYQPQTNPAYPKYAQVPNTGVPPPPPGYPQSTYGAYPQNPMAPPQPAYPLNAGVGHGVHVAQPTVVTVNVQPMQIICAYCHGTMVKETDLCCLMCLIFLAIFTFPFGLPFLCCIPCTVRRRCAQCHRIG